jgi:hypothetical protein
MDSGATIQRRVTLLVLEVPDPPPVPFNPDPPDLAINTSVDTILAWNSSATASRVVSGHRDDGEV